MTVEDAVTRIKIQKARDAWREVHILGYQNRRQALHLLTLQVASRLNLTDAEVEKLISQPKKDK